MAAIILTHPAKAAERVCHSEQLDVWAHEIFQRLNMEEALREDLTYDEQVEIERYLRDEIRSIVESAFTHPEAMKPLPR